MNKIGVFVRADYLICASFVYYFFGNDQSRFERLRISTFLLLMRNQP